MADLSHELGALRFVVDSPLSSKVAMFNNQVAQHKNTQLLNPFSQTDGRASPKPDITKDDYGKPLAGSLTEMRGQKANMHVLREMLELCQIIDSEGYDVKDEPSMRVITFGELFNIYNYISDKCVGILLRARKHKLVEFEGEMLFQRRDDDVPIFLLKPIVEIRREMNDKIESIKRAGSPAPQATSVLLDKKANGLSVPGGRQAVSRTPTPQSSKSSSPVKETKAPAAKVVAPVAVAANTATAAVAREETPKIQISGEPKPEAGQKQSEATQAESSEAKPAAAAAAAKEAPQTTQPILPTEVTAENAVQPTQPDIKDATPAEVKTEIKNVTLAEVKTPENPATQPLIVAEVQPVAVSEAQPQTAAQPVAAPAAELPDDVHSNAEDLPTVVVEATAVYVRPKAAAQANGNATAPEPAVA